MAQKLFTHNVCMTIKSTTQNWMDVKKDINICMNVGIDSDLTSIKAVRFINPYKTK